MSTVIPSPVKAREDEPQIGQEKVFAHTNWTWKRTQQWAILHGIAWTIFPGERWVLLGPNGSGKSTLLSLIQVDNPQVYAQNISLFGIGPNCRVVF